jgi:hypothetical protein
MERKGRLPAPSVFVLLADRADEICLQRREAVQRLALALTERDALLILLQQIAGLKRYDPNKAFKVNHIPTQYTLNVPVAMLELADLMIKNHKRRRERAV